MEPQENDVVIVGAGVAGLTLGLLLGEQGHRVTILDRRTAIEPQYRPELIQPKGLHILNSLGVLPQLLDNETCRCEQFEFVQAGGGDLCHVAYGTLSHPFPYALIAFPHITQSALLGRLSAYPTVQVRWRAALSHVTRNPGSSSRVLFVEDGQRRCLSASVVVGADGKQSHVRRTAGVHVAETRYRDAFLTLVLHRPASWPARVRYYLGRRRILGVFPVSGDRLCLLFMVPARGLERIKTRGLPALAGEIVAIDESLREPIGELTDWRQVSYMECRSLYVAPWVMDGIVLIGDAAHACHPHIAQGSTQAMLDAVALAPVLSGCLEANNCSAERLSAFERARRPTVEALQRIAHEYAWLWNTGNPLLAWVRDRAFREIGRRPHLLSKVMETEAGIRVAPLTAWERLQALGVLS